MQKQIALNFILDSFLENSIQKEIGYLKISKKTENLNLKPVFQKKHLESCKHTIDLKKCFLESKIAPVKDVLSREVKYQKWMDSKSILKITDQKLIINEVINTEQKCIVDHNLLLANKGLPKNLRIIISNQKKVIEKSIEELKNMIRLDW